MKLTPYLVFNGQAQQALDFYTDALDGKVGDLYRYDSMPDVAEEHRGRILHACIAFDGGSMAMADTMPDDPASFGRLGHMLTLVLDSVAQIEQVYTKLTDGAQEIRCPLGEAFFAKRYAEVYDRFGVLWALMYME